MMRRYFKQTWELLRQNKTFSAIYIAGTAVPMVLTMVVLMYYHIRISPVYPELHRDNLYELKSVYTHYENGNWMGGACSLHLIREWFYPLQSAEAVTAIYYYYRPPYYIQLPDGKSEISVKCQSTDPSFFKVFDFKFLDGAPFTDADFHNQRCSAVLSASTARRLFGTEQAAGRHFTMNFREYTVAGVVSDASTLTPLSFGQVYEPYTCMPDYYKLEQHTGNPAGPFTVCFRVADKEQGKRMLADIDELVRKYNTTHASEGSTLELLGPMPSWKRNLESGNQEVDVQEIIMFWGGLVALFLLVPALNLSAMIANRMESRKMEMGIYKAFGAGRRYLLRQVIRENLLLTLLGGALGLIISWSVLVFGSQWVFSLFDSRMQVDGVDIRFMPSMLFSPRIFLCALLFCVILNIVSALVPAWRALRKPIVESLNQKK